MTADVVSLKVTALMRSTRGKKVKRVNLVAYFELAEALLRAGTAVAITQSQKIGYLYFPLLVLRGKVESFITDENGFSVSKHAARDLIAATDEWLNQHSSADGVIQSFDTDVQSWEISQVRGKIDHFKAVFTSECRDVEIYSVDQVAIYKTSELVSSGSGRIHAAIRHLVPPEALREFDEAGKCLAFGLPTSCGFHALRALEIMMATYLDRFDENARELKTWNDYIKAYTKLRERAGDGPKPSPRVVAMLDRMRELDRNPLMHPRDTLDEAGADTLFSLAAITVAEMAKEIQSADGQQSLALVQGSRSSA